jgi:hypothetical protein
MKLQDRLRKAQDAGADFTLLACIFEAASTVDSSQLENLRKHDSRAVRFSTFCNPLTVATSIDLQGDPLIKFAAVFNPSTLTGILDEIGLNQTSLNPVIPEAIHNHKNVSKEFQVFRAISDFEIKEELYDDESEKFFTEAIFDEELWLSWKMSNQVGPLRTVVDLDSLEGLFYLYILGFIEAPAPTRDFWDFFLDFEVSNVSETIEMFGSLPAIPKSLYEECGAVVGARCLAGGWSKNPQLIRSLAWDRQLLSTGVGGFYWQDSRSPRSSVASNEHTPTDLLRDIFKEESEDSDGLNDFPHPVLWRLSCNPAIPEDVIEGIISLIEQNLVTEEFTQSELLVGEPEDFPYGLVTNPAVTGELRNRVETLMRARDLDPEDYVISS